MGSYRSSIPHIIAPTPTRSNTANDIIVEELMAGDTQQEKEMMLFNARVVQPSPSVGPGSPYPQQERMSMSPEHQAELNHLRLLVAQWQAGQSAQQHAPTLPPASLPVNNQINSQQQRHDPRQGPSSGPNSYNTAGQQSSPVQHPTPTHAGNVYNGTHVSGQATVLMGNVQDDPNQRSYNQYNNSTITGQAYVAQGNMSPEQHNNLLLRHAQRTQSPYTWHYPNQCHYHPQPCPQHPPYRPSHGY